MTTPIQVTPEMREAVYAEDCKINGHLIDITNMFQISDEDSRAGRHAPDVQGPDDETFAHIFCRRCSRVWIVFEEGGRDYDQAVKHFEKALKNANQDKAVKPKRKDKKHNHNEGIPPVDPNIPIGGPSVTT